MNIFTMIHERTCLVGVSRIGWIIGVCGSSWNEKEVLVRSGGDDGQLERPN